jgi:hypothetical protein
VDLLSANGVALASMLVSTAPMSELYTILQSLKENVLSTTISKTTIQGLARIVCGMCHAPALTECPCMLFGASNYTELNVLYARQHELLSWIDVHSGHALPQWRHPSAPPAAPEEERTAAAMDLLAWLKTTVDPYWFVYLLRQLNVSSMRQDWIEWCCQIIQMSDWSQEQCWDLLPPPTECYCDALFVQAVRPKSSLPPWQRTIVETILISKQSAFLLPALQEVPSDRAEPTSALGLEGLFFQVQASDSFVDERVLALSGLVGLPLDDFMRQHVCHVLLPALGRPFVARVLVSLMDLQLQQELLGWMNDVAQHMEQTRWNKESLATLLSHPIFLSDDAASEPYLNWLLNLHDKGFLPWMSLASLSWMFVELEDWHPRLATEGDVRTVLSLMDAAQIVARAGDPMRVTAALILPTPSNMTKEHGTAMALVLDVWMQQGDVYEALAFEHLVALSPQPIHSVLRLILEAHARRTGTSVGDLVVAKAGVVFPQWTRLYASIRDFPFRVLSCVSVEEMVILHAADMVPYLVTTQHFNESVQLVSMEHILPSCFASLVSEILLCAYGTGNMDVLSRIPWLQQQLGKSFDRLLATNVDGIVSQVLSHLDTPFASRRSVGMSMAWEDMDAADIALPTTRALYPAEAILQALSHFSTDWMAKELLFRKKRIPFILNRLATMVQQAPFALEKRRLLGVYLFTVASSQGTWQLDFTSLLILHHLLCFLDDADLAEHAMPLLTHYWTQAKHLMNTTVLKDAFLPELLETTTPQRRQLAEWILNQLEGDAHRHPEMNTKLAVYYRDMLNGMEFSKGRHECSPRLLLNMITSEQITSKITLRWILHNLTHSIQHFQSQDTVQSLIVSLLRIVKRLQLDTTTERMLGAVMGELYACVNDAIFLETINTPQHKADSAVHVAKALEALIFSKQLSTSLVALSVLPSFVAYLPQGATALTVLPHWALFKPATTGRSMRTGVASVDQTLLTTPCGYNEWIRDVVPQLCASSSSRLWSCLAPVASISHAFAESLVPLLMLHLIHDQESPNTFAANRLAISSAFDHVFAEQADYSTQLLKLLVNCVAFVCEHRLPHLSTRQELYAWMNLDYFQAAIVAQHIGMHVLAIFFIELDRDHPSATSTEKAQSIADVTTQSFYEMGDLDSFHGVQTHVNQNYLLQHFATSGAWTKYLQYAESSLADTQGEEAFISALCHAGHFHLAQTYLGDLKGGSDTLKSLQFEAAW